MSTADTKALIAKAVERFEAEVPALKKVTLVMKLELQARGDIPTWRVEVPGPKVSKEAAADARVDVSLPRSRFNELVEDGRLSDWVEAYERGHIKVSGEPGVV